MDKEHSHEMTAFIVLLGILTFIVSVLIDMLLRSFSLRVHDDPHAASLRSSWVPGIMLNYFIAAILIAVSVVVGFILLIVPGIILMLALLFTYYIIIEKKLGAVEAMKESMRLTKGHRLKLLGLVLALGAINVLGFILLFVGMLVTIPVTLFAMAHAYRMLSGNAVVEAAAESVEVLPAS